MDKPYGNNLYYPHFFREQVPSIWGSYGIDSGGTLTKIVYFRPQNTPNLPEYVVLDKTVPDTLPGVRPDPLLKVDIKGKNSVPPWSSQLLVEGQSAEMKFIKIPKQNMLDFINFAARKFPSKLQYSLC